VAFGGYDTQLVVDIPGRGLSPYETAPDFAPRLEPGVQLFGSALQSCLRRWHILITAGHKLPQELKGWPSLV
jgi:hypothetical protein